MPRLAPKLFPAADRALDLALTVSEGAVRKYIRVMQHVIDHYGVDMYTRQRVNGLVNSTDSLFKNDRVKVFTLDDFISG